MTEFGESGTLPEVLRHVMDETCRESLNIGSCESTTFIPPTKTTKDGRVADLSPAGAGMPFYGSSARAGSNP
ncbi:MAG: hypothetical protein R3C01_01545, partial [Planctomycetaceae bacterium]